MGNSQAELLNQTTWTTNNNVVWIKRNKTTKKLCIKQIKPINYTKSK